MPFPSTIIDQFIRAIAAFTLLSIMLWLGPVSCLRRAWRRTITRPAIVLRAVCRMMSRAERVRTRRSASAPSSTSLISIPAALLIVLLLTGVLLLLGVLWTYPSQALAGLELLFGVRHG